MNKTQLQTTFAPLVGVAAGYLAGAHILNLSAGDWSIVLGSILAAVSVIWPAIVTRETTLKDTVGNMSHTTVVTDEASAKALPDNKDVVAVTPAIAAAIKASNPS